MKPTITPPPGQVSLGRAIGNTITGNSTTEAVILDIQSGKYADKIKFLRTLTGVAFDNYKKTKIPAVLWSGTFSKRCEAGLIRHSGQLCADIDKVGEARVQELRAKAGSDPHVVAGFVSPSGIGLKLVFLVSNDASLHPQSFAAVRSHVASFYGEAVDEACKDVARLCFLSHDPNAFYNPEAVELPTGTNAAAVELPANTVESAPASNLTLTASTPESRQQIAQKLLGSIVWESDTLGFCNCPGKHLHTTGNGAKDCRVHLDGAPNIHCVHNSCTDFCDSVNKVLCSRIGSAEWQKDSKPVSQVAPTDEAKQRIRTALASRRFNFAIVPPPVHPVYSVNGIHISTPGNITCITAQLKSGKSSWMAAMIAAAMTCDREADCLGVESSNPEGKALIHIDTEQAPQDWDGLIRQALRRARLDSAPAWLLSYCLTGWNLPDARLALPVILEDARRDWGAVHSVLIDGVADLVPSVNDEEESLAFVSSIHGQAIEYSCPIIGAIHFNPNSDKTRGHLGSQMERKAETNLRLDKEEGEIVTAYSLKSRKAPITKNLAPRFAWSNEHGMHVSTESLRQTKNDLQIDDDRMKVDEAFRLSGKSALHYSDLISHIHRATGKKTESLSTAERIFRRVSDARYIAKNIIKQWEVSA